METAARGPKHRHWGNTTAEEWALILAASKHRIAAGYVFPPLPESSSTWNEEFHYCIQSCAYVLKQRIKDLGNVDSPSESMTIHNDALSEFHSAMAYRDLTLVKLHHRLLLNTSAPKFIARARHALTPQHHPDTMTEDHVLACKAVFEALTTPNEDGFFTWGPHDDDVAPRAAVLTSICFDELSPERTAVVMLIRRGITDTEQVRAAVEGISDIADPLLEGVL